jgi:SAM-dependent methyltransferase
MLEASVLAGNYYDESERAIDERSVASKRARFPEYETLLREAFPSPGRVLDVGCNAGELLQLFAERGWSVAGVEASPGPAAYARKRLGESIWHGTVESALPETERFDLVTLTHVLEHLHDPVGVLSRLRRALRPGGRLLVEVPNANDFLLPLWRGFYRPLCPGDHLSFFTDRTLIAALQRAGFRALRMESPTHARDVVFPSLLSAVDAARSFRRVPNGGQGGVTTQFRYRGALRSRLRSALDAITAALDPLTVAATAGLARQMRGPVLIAVAESA